MFCGQCGKRVLETMLFCPFCGAPIVIPDQEDAPETPAPAEIPETPEAVTEETAEIPEVPEAEPTPEEDELFTVEPEEKFEPLRFDEPEPEPEPEAPPAEEPVSRPASIFDDFADDGEDSFQPLNFDADEPAAEEPEPEPAAPENIIPLEDPPRRSPAQAQRRPEGASRRSSQTFIPVRNVDLDDIFMDSSHPDPEDEFDPYDDDADEDFGEDFDFEEPERGSFLQRHIRGVVSFILLLMLIVICLIWLAMPKGQKLLATANLAWNAETYNDLGYEAYNSGQFRQAATYFERALARDDDNYEYAHSAMVAYYEAEQIDSALAMLKKCIEMRPNVAEAYHELLILYPDASARPWEVQQLLRQGYERTGDAALNVGGE